MVKIAKNKNLTKGLLECKFACFMSFGYIEKQSNQICTKYQKCQYLLE